MGVFYSPNDLRSRFLRIAFLLLLPAPAIGGVPMDLFQVELPAPETAERLVRCLSASGFEVTRNEVSGSAVRIRANRGEEVREIAVTPRSPLGSVVDWGTDTAGPYLPATGGDLRLCIRRDGAPSEVLEAERYVVCLRARRDGREIRFTGLLAGMGGTIVTTAHDLERIDEVRVHFQDGRTVLGTIGKRDPKRDLSRIDLAEPASGFPIERRSRARLTPDEPLFSIGCADAGTLRLREGRVASTSRTSGGIPLWEVRMETVPGSSGGPAFDAGGDLAGLVKGRFRGTNDRGYLIPAGAILDFLGTAKRGER